DVSAAGNMIFAAASHYTMHGRQYILITGRYDNKRFFHGFSCKAIHQQILPKNRKNSMCSETKNFNGI
ncbi:MAG: hypothetical protein ACTS8P_02995, partial [Arsenophonus sp. NC-XBC3-MAG3]